MDRQWMYNRLTYGRKFSNPEFMIGIESFVQYASGQSAFMDGEKIRCPCCKCQNRSYETVDDVKLHLMRVGFVKDYYQWVCHREPLVRSNYSQTECNASCSGDVKGSNSYREMVIDAIGHNYDPHYNANKEETPNATTQSLYNMLHATPHELFIHTHTKKHDGETFDDSKAKTINDKMLTLKEQACAQAAESGSSEPTSINDLALYYQAVGGEKKRRIYGLESQASFYYGCSNSNINTSTATSPATQVNEDLQNELAFMRSKLENQEQRHQQELQKTREEMAEMRRMIELLVSNRNASP